MATKTKADALNDASPTNLADLLRELAPALLSSLRSNLPLAVRAPELPAVPVAADTTGALGNAGTGSGVAGTVLEVNATVAGAPGVKTIVSGAPAAGQAQVTYDADGIPTVNFNVADAVTECAIKMNAVASDFVRTLAASATM